MMRGSAARLLPALVALLVGWLAGMSVAQPPSGAVPAPVDETLANESRAAEIDDATSSGSGDDRPARKPSPSSPANAWPDTTIWIDDNGVPRPMVGVTYEEFAKAWRQYQGLGEREREPRYTLHALRIEGELPSDAASSVVELDANFEVQVHKSGLVGAPIRLRNAIFTGEVEGLDGKSERLAYDEARGGYLLWLRGEERKQAETNTNTRRQVRLKLLARVDRSADGVRVRLNLPRATRSRFVMRTDRPVLAPTVSEGRLVATEEPGGGSQLEITGAVGKTTLTFRLPETKPTTSAEDAPLRARGQVRIDISDRSVRSSARLTVDGLGRTFDRFVVRLPEGAAQLPGSEDQPEGVRVAGAGVDDAGRTLVEVSRTSRSSDPLTVQLVAERPIDARAKEGDEDQGKATDKRVDLAGFEVVGVALQSGDLAVSVAEGVQLEWGQRVGATRIEPSLLPEELARQSPPIAIRYYSPAWRLPVRIGSPEPSVEATPEYRLELRGDEARLTMDTSFRVFGGGKFEFAYDLNGWAEPADAPTGSVGLVDASQVHTSGDRLFVPLTRAAGRRDSLSIVLRRPLADDEPLDLTLPIPVADVLGAGRLTVIADPGVELRVRDDQLARLEPVAVSPNDANAEDPAALRTRAYRVLPPVAVAEADNTPPRFSANLLRRPGRVLTESVATATVEARAVQIDQQLICNVLYRPLDRVLLRLPEGTDFADTPTATLLGETASSDEIGVRLIAERALTDDPPAEGGNADADGVLWSVALPGPRLGTFRLQMNFSVPRPATLDEPFRVPLVEMVLDNAEDDQPVEVTAVAAPGEGLAIANPTFGWQAVGGGPEALRLTRQPDASLLWLRGTLSSPTEPTDVTVQRAWLQTWDAGVRRQMRAVFRISGSSEQLTVRPPQGVDVEAIEASLDGAPITLRTGGDGAGRLRDESLADGEPHTLTLRYLAPLGDPFQTRLATPRLDARDDSTECYWEVIQPTNRHALAAPAGFAGHYRWAWRDGWGRQPLLDAAALAALTGADPGPQPSAGEHRYLYFRFGVPRDTPLLRSASREGMLLIVSAAVVVIGFAMSQLRLFRYRATYYGLVAAFAAAGLLAPESALLAFQAGGVGLLLAAATILADRAIRGERRDESLVLSDQSTSFGQVTLRRSVDDAVSTSAPTASLTAGDSGRET